jgi:hypothetical protein
MRLRRPLLVLTAAVLVGLWLVNCSGPRPQVSHIQLTVPRAAGTPYAVQAVVHNAGLGHGTVNVQFTLSDVRTGYTAQQEESVTLSFGETTFVSADIPAPIALYRVEVRAEYPQR